MVKIMCLWVWLCNMGYNVGNKFNFDFLIVTVNISCSLVNVLKLNVFGSNGFQL